MQSLDSYPVPDRKDTSSNLSVFREIFKECSIFSKKIYTLLNEHEDQMAKKRKALGGVPQGAVPPPMPDSPNAKNRAKKRKKDGPKRPLSSYMLFVQKERPMIVEKHPDLKFTDIGKLLGSQWAKLTEEERKKYVDMASDDKARYNQELAVFTSSQGEHHPMENDEDEHGHHDPEASDPRQLLPTMASAENRDKDMADSER